MKKELQPKVYTDCVVTCACGNSFVTTSTQPNITVDICSACHPFYTGKQKFVDTEGRIEKFERKLKIAEEKAKDKKKGKDKGKGSQEEKKKKRTLKEMLEEAQDES